MVSLASPRKIVISWKKSSTANFPQGALTTLIATQQISVPEHMLLDTSSDNPIGDTLRSSGLRITSDLYTAIHSGLDDNEASFIPRRLFVAYDCTRSLEDVGQFVDAIKSYLIRDIRKTNLRISHAPLATGNNIRSLVASINENHPQPWFILFRDKDGFTDIIDPDATNTGLLPCISMDRHGIIWHRVSSADYESALLTSPSGRSGWDFDSDIGHEGGHAAYAPVPLFGQSVEHYFPQLTFSPDQGRLAGFGEVAKMMYFLTELAIPCIRGETRDTSTGLFIQSFEELTSLLRFAQVYFQDEEFEIAAHLIERACLPLTHESPSLIRLAVPVLRAILSFLPRINRSSLEFCCPERIYQMHSPKLA